MHGLHVTCFCVDAVNACLKNILPFNGIANFNPINLAQLEVGKRPVSCMGASCQDSTGILAVVKMGVSAAMMSMKKAGLEKVDAIITGTGMGCYEDTDKFLRSMLDNKEQLLTPTAFIQSTHNTVAGQIALIFKCSGIGYARTARYLFLR